METVDVWPRILVSALITVGSGRVLLTRHAANGKWHCPDGDVHRGERLRDAIRRSVKEDLGIDIDPGPEPVMATETIAHGGAPHYVTLHFAASALPQNVIFAPARGIDHRFFSEKNLHAASTLASTRLILRTRLGWRI